MEDFMKEALAQARLALSRGEVPVGCVFVCNNKIIASGGNNVNATKNATRHAEFQCIDQVLELCAKKLLTSDEREEIFRNISVVVTVEPCIMCMGTLLNLGIKDIWYGCSNDRFGGKTVVDVRQIIGKKCPIVGNIYGDEAMKLLKDFYKGDNPAAPSTAKCKKLNKQ